MSIHPASPGVAAHTAVVLRQFQGPERGLEVFGHRINFLLAGGITRPTEAPKWPKIRSQYRLDLQPQKIVEKRENTSDIGAGCEIIWMAPPAKADIATAILTNVTWAFSVAVLQPNKHAFTAKAVWADLS